MPPPLDYAVPQRTPISVGRLIWHTVIGLVCVAPLAIIVSSFLQPGWLFRCFGLVAINWIFGTAVAASLVTSFLMMLRAKRADNAVLWMVAFWFSLLVSAFGTLLLIFANSFTMPSPN